MGQVLAHVVVLASASDVWTCVFMLGPLREPPQKLKDCLLEDGVSLTCWHRSRSGNGSDSMKAALGALFFLRGDMEGNDRSRGCRRDARSSRGFTFERTARGRMT